MQTAIYPFFQPFASAADAPPFATSCHFPRKTGKFTRRRRLFMFTLF